MVSLFEQNQITLWESEHPFWQDSWTGLRWNWSEKVANFKLGLSLNFHLPLDPIWFQPFSTGAVNVWHSVNHLVSENKSDIAQPHKSKDAQLHLEYLHSCSPGRVKCLYISGGLTNLGNVSIWEILNFGSKKSPKQPPENFLNSGYTQSLNTPGGHSAGFQRRPSQWSQRWTWVNFSWKYWQIVNCEEGAPVTAHEAVQVNLAAFRIIGLRDAWSSWCFEVKI